MKIRTEQGGGSEKQGFGAAKGLANPTFGRIIAQPTCTSKSNPMNNRSNGKSRFRAMLSLGQIGADSKVRFKFVAIIALLLFGITGCDIQRGRFVTSGDRCWPFSSPGGICIVQGSPTTPLIGGASGSDQNLLYVIFISPKLPQKDTSGISFSKYVTTLIQTLSTGTRDIKVSFDWNRQKDTIAVGKQEFPHEKGNVFVVRLDSNGEVVCRQLASLSLDSSFQQVLDHARQQMPNDEQIRKLTLKATP